jgi:hypothetical protein
MMSNLTVHSLILPHSLTAIQYGEWGTLAREKFEKGFKEFENKANDINNK